MTTDKFKATITKPDLFCAAAVCIGTGEIRYYLKGVYIEPAKKGAYLVATDGHRLFCGYDEGATVNRPAIITPPKIRMPVKWTKPGKLTLEDGRARHDLGLVDSAREIDGAFPDYRRVIPAELTGKYEDAPDKNPNEAYSRPHRRTAFNPQYLYDFALMQKMLFDARLIDVLRLTPNGTGPALIVLRDDAFGLLMPVKCGVVDDPLPSYPNWVPEMRSHSWEQQAKAAE